MRIPDNIPWNLILPIAGLILVFAAWFLLPLQNFLEFFTGWVDSLGALGFLMFGAAYIVATIVLIPAALLTLAAGLTYGFWGYPLVLICATAGASIAFLIARLFFRERVEEQFSDNEKFQAIDGAIKEQGWKVVALMRLSPLFPFNLQNYLYGATDISFVHHGLATLLGIIPGSLMYVYFGSAGNAAITGSQSEGDSTLRWIMFALGLLATIAITFLITRKAKSKLEEFGMEKESK